MKYSLNLLDKSIELIVPTAGIVRSAGVGYDRNAWMRQVAIEFFKDPSIEFRTMNHGYAILVIRTALKELSDRGYLTFGETDEFWG